MKLNVIGKSLFVGAAAVGLMFAACGKEEDKKEEAVPSEVTMTGTLALNATALKLTTAITDYVLYCVTFEEEPRARKSDFAADGAFSVSIPSQVQIGCFVNEKASNTSKFSFVFETGESSKMGGSTTTGVALKGNLDLGALKVGTDGKIVVAAAKVGEVKAKVEGVKAKDLHNKSFKMECITKGDVTEADIKFCKEELLEGKESGVVFFRYVTAQENGKDIEGLGIWGGEEAFKKCGSFDITPTFQAKLKSEGVEFTSDVAVGAFACSVGKNDQKPVDVGNAEGYFTFNKVTPNGAGFSFIEDIQENHGGGCEVTHRTAIDFGGTAQAMTGAFNTSETRINCSDEGKPVVPLYTSMARFAVKFTAM